MRDLAILVPSRGRPASVARLAGVCEKTCRTDYQLVFAFDDDDPDIQASKRAAGRSYVYTGPRKGLAAWTNVLWRELRHDFAYFASIGDDHIPQTDGWDKHLTGALDAHGGGFSYCWNGHEQETPNLPEMCVASAPVLAALGWFAEPTMEHFCIDNVWKDLGLAADCLYYLPDVTLYHDNWATPAKSPRDATYWDAIQRGHMDVQAHAKWRMERMAADVSKVKTALTPR